MAEHYAHQSALVDASPVADPAVWRIVGTHHPAAYPDERRGWLVPTVTFFVGLLLTTAAAGAVWCYCAPDTVVQTRIVTDGQDGAGRAALADIALRLASIPDRPVALQDDGETLVVSARAADPVEAGQRMRSLVNAILNVPIAVTAPAAEVAPAGTAAALRADRARITAAMDTLDARSTSVSTSLAGVAQQMAAASRSAADRKPGRDTLDKGNAVLAELQLQRLQLSTKYQDSFPAVQVMDGQIKTLRTFLADESHRVDARPGQPDPVDAMLAAERDRLKAELTQLSDRRRELVAQLGLVSARLAALPVVPAIVAPAPPPAPMLVAAAMTSAPDADERLVRIPAIVATGLLLSMLAALLSRTRHKRGLPGGLVLEPMQSGRLHAAHPYVLPASGSHRVTDAARWSEPSHQ